MSPEPRIVHVDNHLLVVDKPAGMPSVPDESGDASVLDWGRAWIAREYRKPGAVFLGVVHRLDRPVSGVLVFARTSKAAGRLSTAFRERVIEKTYWGVGAVAPDPPAGRIEQWLVKDPVARRVRPVAPEAAGSRRALTEWRVLERTSAGVLVELRPATGRPHQLRAAMAALGAPLLGDTKYGAGAPLRDGSIALHASELELPHPVRAERFAFCAPPPDRAWWRFEPCVHARTRGIETRVRR